MVPIMCLSGILLHGGITYQSDFNRPMPARFERQGFTGAPFKSNAITVGRLDAQAVLFTENLPVVARPLAEPSTLDPECRICHGRLFSCIVLQHGNIVIRLITLLALKLSGERPCIVAI